MNPQKLPLPVSIAIIGSGPAGLVAATLLSQINHFQVHLFEKRKNLGRKLLIAGSSGLNISNAEKKITAFASHYENNEHNKPDFLRYLNVFPPSAWFEFLNGLGFKTFKGTSNRYFLGEPSKKSSMKAATLLDVWKKKLLEQNVHIHTEHEWIDFDSTPEAIQIDFKNQPSFKCKIVIFALGGASWENHENQGTNLLSIFERKKIKTKPFESKNCGFGIQWKPEFLAEAIRQPLKNICLHVDNKSMTGDLMITDYGIEGTPIYTLGRPGPIQIDLKPDLTLAEIKQKLLKSKENLSPIRRAKKLLNLSTTALALLYHHSNDLTDITKLAQSIKSFRLTLTNPQPLEQAISSQGGVCFSELNEDLSLKKFPNIFIIGELLNWNAPTGGFLIQGCVSQAAYVAQKIITANQPHS